MKGSKKIVGTAVGMVALLAIGGTFAYYTGETSIDNMLETASYGDELVEVFTPDDDWEPGETVDKIVGVTNTGDYDIVVRVSMSEAWYDAEGSEIITIASTDTSAGFLDASATTADQLSATDGLIDDSQDTVNNEESLNVGTDAVVDNEIDGSVVYKALTTESDATTTDSWYYNSSDGYWYYTSILASGESTGSLLSSLTLAEDTDMGLYSEVTYYCVSEESDVDDFTNEEWLELNDADGSNATDLADVEVDTDEYLHIRSVSTLTEDYEGYAGATYVLTITSYTCQATEDAIATWTTAPTALSWVTTD